MVVALLSKAERVGLGLALTEDMFLQDLLSTLLYQKKLRTRVNLNVIIRLCCEKCQESFR